MYYAMLPSTDSRYKKRHDDWNILHNRFNKKINTYKNGKDAFDRYFDNNRKGWSDERALSARGKGYQEVYDLYSEYSVDVVEIAVREIIDMLSQEENNFVSMKCGFPKTVHEILDGEKTITIDGLYTLKEELVTGKILFLTLGGDVGKASVDWSPGFVGIAHVVREPFEFGYDGRDKYFKIDISIDCVFEKPFKREDFIRYPNAYDAAYIGPELSRDPSQAIASLDTKKAVTIIRAVLDKYSDLEETFLNIFGEEFMARVCGAVQVMVPVSINYGETEKDVIDSIEEELSYKRDRELLETDRIEGGKNVLYYGVPGSGKSHTINEIIDDKPYERVVFHPDYTYSDFVGQIMPKLQKDKRGTERLTYKFEEGPFTKIMKKANKAENADKMFYLVIEEINRGNAPAIFGDIFQLLDRKETGESKYYITNFDIADKVYGDELAKVRIPSNLSILATMNTSDQNVFTLDTAFQRRWNMKHIKNDIGAAKHADVNIEGSSVTWGQFASAVNAELLNANEDILGSEDKQLGAYFVEKDELSAKKFPEKALKYLWDDAFKMGRDAIFDTDIKSIGDLVTIYEDEFEKGNDPIKRVMKKEVFERMMDLSAKSVEDAYKDDEIFEAQKDD